MKQFHWKMYGLAALLGTALGLCGALQMAPAGCDNAAPAHQVVATAEQPKPDEHPRTHERGLKLPPPDKLKQLHQASFERHKERLHIQQRVTPPPAWDSRTKGWIPPIKNQGNCGSCWDFSGTGVVETAYWVVGQQKVFSDQYTLDCYSNGGCNGDDNTTVLAHAKSAGLPISADYGPYKANEGSCHVGSLPLFKITDWGYADHSNGDGVTATKDIQVAIQLYGCVGSAVAAGNDWDNVGPGSTITGRNTGINHDVILVGWDDNHDNGNGTRGAWILRNSWGTNWGDQGYCWIKYGADGIGTEAVFAYLTAPTPPSPPNPPGTPATAAIATALPAGSQVVATNSTGVAVGTITVTAPVQPGSYPGTTTAPPSNSVGTVTFTVAEPAGTVLMFAGVGSLTLTAPVAAGDTLTLTTK